MFASLCADESISSPTPGQSPRSRHFDVLGERVRVHRDLGMRVRAEKLRAFHADGPIAERRALGGAGDDTDVLRHELLDDHPRVATNRPVLPSY